MSVLREILRNFRWNVFVIGSAWWVAFFVALVAGVPAVPLFAVAIGLGTVLAALLAFVPREAVLRRVTNRPRRIMTPDDYRHLRELEAELGWEPSELPVPVAELSAADETRNALTAAGSITFSGTAALSGTGTVSAKATWDDVAYPSGASQHFAALARVGRESCISDCPMCAERRLFGPFPGESKEDASMRQWIEKERWGQ